MEDLKVFLHSGPEAFINLVSTLARHQTIYIDTETADWWTVNPRVSLLQIQFQSGEVHVIDLLAPGMTETLESVFIPAIMSNVAIEKWAHSARYEKRFLGGDRVNSLRCTIELARTIPFYRLPVSSFSLGSLVKHFFGVRLDKSFQKNDWGQRPLSREQLSYAAWDPEWCRRIHQRLNSMIQTFDPSTESPFEINELYLPVLIRIRDQKLRVAEIRNSVRDHMLANEMSKFSDFSMHSRTSKTIAVASLIEMARIKDPQRLIDFTMNLSKKLVDTLIPGAFDALQESITTRQASAFRGPVAPKLKNKSAFYYELDPSDSAVSEDYAQADKELRIAESEKFELRERMKAWMEFQNTRSWEQWSFTDPVPRWSIDIRDLEAFIPVYGSCEVNLPKRFELAFTPEEIEVHQNVVNAKVTRYLVWRPGVTAGLNPTEFRDWYGSEENED